jgi:hypothetical protein
MGQIAWSSVKKDLQSVGVNHGLIYSTMLDIWMEMRKFTMQNVMQDTQTQAQ